MKKKTSSQVEVEQRKSGGSFATGLILGTLVGMGATFLYGTKRGAKIRRSFEGEMKKAKIKGKQLGDQAVNVVTEKVDRAEKLLERARMEVDLAVKEGASKANEIKNEVKKSSRLAKIKKVFTKSGKPLKK